MNRTQPYRIEIDPSTLRGHAGFYRVAKSTQGHWWLIDPAGQPMIYKDCNAALRQAVGQAGKNMYFQWVESQFGADTPRFIRNPQFNLHVNKP